MDERLLSQVISMKPMTHQTQDYIYKAIITQLPDYLSKFEIKRQKKIFSSSGPQTKSG